MTNEIEVRRSARRQKTATAFREDGRIVVVLPATMAASEEQHWVDELVRRLLAREQRRRAPHGDAELIERAERLAAACLDPQLPHPAPRARSIRWVTNQNRRWGSCSTSTREIRLSHRLQAMPSFVVDYVILHELAHLIEADHSAAFWRLLEDCPDRERARGYLEGWSAATAASSASPAGAG